MSVDERAGPARADDGHADACRGHELSDGGRPDDGRSADDHADPSRATLERAFHEAYGRLVAVLVRRFGTAHLDLVENMVQESMLRALQRWPLDGIPDNPSGWLFRTAHHLALDALRREQRLQPIESDRRTSEAIAGRSTSDSADAAATTAPAAARADADSRYTDSLGDEIPLIFLCCHPDLPRASQVALTLKLACGFTAAQIARAFLTDEPTIAQRIVRAKQRLRRIEARIEMPAPDEIPTRLDAILDVLYLVFNEGYSPSDGDEGVKEDLCREALRLVTLLTMPAADAAVAAGGGAAAPRQAAAAGHPELEDSTRATAAPPPTAAPAAEALAALLCLQASRLAARLASDGSLLLLAEQDRSRWDAALIAEGLTHLTRSARGGVVTRFHLEAGIAASHARAATHAATDWPHIRYLYDALRVCAPSPIVDVNRAIAVAMMDGAVAGLDELDAIPERELLDRYPYALAAYAELHTTLGHVDEACRYLRRALDRQPVRAQRALLERKLRALTAAAI